MREFALLLVRTVPVLHELLAELRFLIAGFYGSYCLPGHITG